jgi:hypothetical protein
MHELRWFLADDSPVLRYAVGFLTEAVGLVPVMLDRPPSDETPYVHHGDGLPPGRHGLLVPVQRDGVPPLSIDVVPDGPPRLSGDILYGAVAFLTDAVHAHTGRSDVDRHGRLRAATSHMAERGSVSDPVVNRYAARLAEALPLMGDYTPSPRWPDGARAAIGLSHDVDRPEKYAILRAIRRMQLPPPDRLPWFAARAARDFAHRLRDPHPDDFWLFDQVVAAEASHGFESTFMFSVVPSYASYGSTNDVLYDAAWPHLRRQMSSLRDQGVELGLHASYHAHRDPARFWLERQRLEELSAGSVRGLRHHFWQVGPDVSATLRAHEAAGFHYDSSLAFNDAVGLRRAVALPYRPWDATAQRPLSTWQLPVLALDSAACATARDAGEAIEAVWSGIEQVIASHGVAVLDWHVRCSYPANDRYRLWAETYVGVLERLATRKDVWVTGLGKITDWAASRAKTLENLP